MHGKAANDANFNYAWDKVRYSILLPEGKSGESYTVVIELRYQPLSYAFLRDLFLDNDLTAVDRFEQMYLASSLRSEVLARKRFSITR